MYEELVTRLREFASIPEHCETVDDCSQCTKESICLSFTNRRIIDVATEAADAIEELMKAAKAMHTWIFLNSGDEQAAYDECGLSDEMNAMLGYGGQFVVEPPKEET
jgi:hypothetical protein